MSDTESTDQSNFKKVALTIDFEASSIISIQFRSVCVPLLAASRLSASSISSTTILLSEIINLLKGISPENLTSNLISYIFLPLSTILQRNSSAEIPDQVLEKVLVAFYHLAESWWWTCDLRVWDQMFLICSAIVGGLDRKTASKSKSRDDETVEAAMSCIFTLLRPRTSEEAQRRSLSYDQAKDRFNELQEHAQSEKFVAIVGQTLDSALMSAESSYMPLQRCSLEVLSLFIDLYLPDHIIPSVLPGVVSKMTKVCLGIPASKGWANGEVVARGLNVLQGVVIKSIGDEACIKEGAVRRFNDLEDVFEEPELPQNSTDTYGTRRTRSWLRGTATQLYIALNSLTPLVSHPTPSALHALTKASASILGATSLTLPLTQSLLLSFLLSLSLSDYPLVSSESRNSLLELLTRRSDAQSSLQHTLMVNLGDNLSALPRLLSTQTDAKISHTATLVEAVCRLAYVADDQIPFGPVVKGLGKLLGPTGGIEKWGWSLLSVLEFVEPPIVVANSSVGQLALETDGDVPDWLSFPELIFKNVSSHNTRQSLENMFLALGSAGGDGCLFAVEWFANVGRLGTTSTSVAALWCACKLLEGAANINLSERRIAATDNPPSRRLAKQVRGLAKSIAELWDKTDFEFTQNTKPSDGDDDSTFFVQHRKGLVPIHDTLKIHESRPKLPSTSLQPMIHRALCLQIIAITAGVTQSRFAPLFIHTLYPILHSLISPLSFLSSTAVATLRFIAIFTSYASPANLLLSNFDYVLDAVSRRLTQRWLDIDATKVLCVMIRLVGRDVVDRAGDVVEECFDRLDEFHGYGIIVDGLIEVLTEVIKVIEVDNKADSQTHSTPAVPIFQRPNLDDFFTFLPHRAEIPLQEFDDTDFGPAPRKPWKSQVPEEEVVDNEPKKSQANSTDEPLPTPIQLLTKQIISRSMYFLTHDSPVIRAKILNLLALSVPVLPGSALLPAIHAAWPFVLNRLGDFETFVVSAAAGLVEVLAIHVGDFMFRRIWDDVWPKFLSLLQSLEAGEASNALTRHEKTGIRSDSAYTHSHRLYRSLLISMTAALKGVHQHEVSFWQVIVAFRRFLGTQAQEELQQCALNLYIQAGQVNPDAVWLVLKSTTVETDPLLQFMEQSRWNIDRNADIVLQALG
jgi:TELO2-interacting protein 1